ncbi:MAG TPA: penicillin-binding protein 2 [Actinomycetota bacterium]|nr:penicillin-binding protein 2 [Actinomycetota bacterium]
MNRQIRRLGYAFTALFVLLFAAVNYIQVYAAGDLANNPSNQRLLLQEYNVHRGQILARDERTVLATSKTTKGRLKYLRVYPRARLYAGVTGYYSVVFGRYGLEQSQNEWLAGRASELLPQNLVDEMLGRDKRGATVVTTIDPKLQRVAARQLGSLPGGVVAMDPGTGEILALVANPSYDPNDLSSHNLTEVKADRARLLKDPDKPLLSRAAQELFPPGSTFKLVTAAAALENGMKPDTKFPNPPALKLPQTTHELHNFGGEHCLGGAAQLTLAQALEVSCNVVFGEIGLKLGADKLVGQARRFGFDQDVPLEIPYASGSIPPVKDFQDALPAVAFSAIGQQSVGANPLQMALVGSALANGGEEMTPRLVKEIRDPSGRVIKSFAPRPWGRPVSEGTAKDMTRMMIRVVEAGTGTAAQIPGVTVAGKTGTAETTSGNPHAWFVCFAPAENPKIVVAVVVLNGGSLGSEATGGHVAAPIARAVIRAALGG